MRPSLKLTFFLITHSDIIAKIIQKSVNYLHMSQLLGKKNSPNQMVAFFFLFFSFSVRFWKSELAGWQIFSVKCLELRFTNNVLKLHLNSFKLLSFLYLEVSFLWRDKLSSMNSHLLGAISLYFISDSWEHVDIFSTIINVHSSAANITFLIGLFSLVPPTCSLKHALL